jgi:hypothetical protein
VKFITYICGFLVILTLSAIAWKVWATRTVTIRKGQWITDAPSPERLCSYSISQFAPYRSEAVPELDGLAAITLDIAPIKGQLRLCLASSNASAELRDGTAAKVKALRPMRFNTDERVLRESGNVQEMIDGSSRIGDVSVQYGFVTFGFGDESSVLYIDGNGTDTMTLGLIFDSTVTNVRAITVFGKTLISKQSESSF